MKRLFAAIHLTPSAGFSKAQNMLMDELSFCRINWSLPSQLHMTLKFFGETAESAIPSITATMSSVSASFNALSVHSQSLGIFGSSYKPRVIWVSFEEFDQLALMGESYLNAFAQSGFPRDSQNFVPHLTLGRIKEIPHLSSFQEVLSKHRSAFSQEFSLSEAILFESILGKQGPTYIPLHRAPFNHDP